MERSNTRGGRQRHAWTKRFTKRPRVLHYRMRRLWLAGCMLRWFENASTQRPRRRPLQLPSTSRVRTLSHLEVADHDLHRVSEEVHPADVGKRLRHLRWVFGGICFGSSGVGECIAAGFHRHPRNERGHCSDPWRAAWAAACDPAATNLRQHTESSAAWIPGERPG